MLCVSLCVQVDYTSDPLLQDEAFRRSIMVSVARVGLEVERALGSVQDVEGVVDSDGVVTVVQTRPQM